MELCTCKQGDKPEDCPAHMRFYRGQDHDDNDDSPYQNDDEDYQSRTD